MKTISLNVYKFNELSEKAKIKAIEKLSSINVNFEWWESTYEDAKNIGLQLDSFDLDRNRHATGKFIQSSINCAELIFKNHGKECKTYKSAKEFSEIYEPFANKRIQEDDEFHEMNEIFLKDLLEVYSIILQSEFDYLISNDAIIEAIEANDYNFLEDGTQY